MGLIKWFKKRFRKEPKNEQEKNQRLAENLVRIRVYRYINQSPIEIGVFEATLDRDENDNVLITNEDQLFKEELPGQRDALINEIISRLESGEKTPKTQIDKLQNEIEKQEKIIANTKEGKVSVKNKDGTKTEIKVNIITERVKLTLLKAALYTIKFLKGEGTYETIESDGVRTLFYAVQDGSVKPCFWKAPTMDGEPVIVTPDVTQRQKFYKSKMDELRDDYLKSQNTMWKGILSVIVQVLFILFFIGNIIFAVHLVNWQKEIAKDADMDELSKCTTQLDQCMRNQERVIANQQDTQGTLIEWARRDIQKRMDAQKQTTAKAQNVSI